MARQVKGGPQGETRSLAQLNAAIKAQGSHLRHASARQALHAQRLGWGLTQRIAYCDEAIAGNSRGESDNAASVGPRRPTSGVL